MSTNTVKPGFSTSGMGSGLSSSGRSIPHCWSCRASNTVRRLPRSGWISFAKSYAAILMWQSTFTSAKYGLARSWNLPLIILGNGPIGRSVDVASATLAHTRITASIFLGETKHYRGGYSRGCRGRGGEKGNERFEDGVERVVERVIRWGDCCMDGCVDGLWMILDEIGWVT